MKTEIDNAVKWLGIYLSKSFPSEKVSRFESSLSSILQDKFNGHWDPERPHHGNAFRAISIIGGRADACLDQVLKELGVPRPEAHFPANLCLWIDPYCVAYKLGEYGHAQTLYIDEQALKILDVPVYFKSPTSRVRSPYPITGVINVNGTTHYNTSPPTPSSNNSSSHNSSSIKINTVATISHLTIPSNSGTSIAASPPLYPKFPQPTSARSTSSYADANGGQYMLVSAQ